MTLEEALIEVWRQTLVDKAKTIRLGDQTYPVRLTRKRNLRQVDFEIDGQDIRGLEQNPITTSRWAAMARSGKKVVQFLMHGRYIAGVADGKLTRYGPKRG